MAKKTRTELSTLAINTNLPDNTSELITPTTERAQLTDERESVVNYKDDLGGVSNAGKFLTVAVDGESLTMVDEPSGVPDWVTFVTAAINKMKLLSGSSSGELQFLYDVAGVDTLGARISWSSSGNLIIGNNFFTAELSISNQFNFIQGGSVRLRIETTGDLTHNADIMALNAQQAFGNSPLYTFKFQGKVTGPSGGSYTFEEFANIKGGKENATENDKAGYLSFTTGIADGTLTERLRISSGGVVGIGVTPSAQSGGALAGSVETDGILRVRGGNGRYFSSGNGLELSKSSIYSYDRGNGNYNALSINDTITVEGAGLATFSNGIQFGTGDTLDAYEEGTWTPVLSSSGGGFSSTTSLTDSATYRRIGSLVFISWFKNPLVITSGGTGVAQITGLPFIPLYAPAAQYAISSAFNNSFTNYVSSFRLTLSGTSGIMFGTENQNTVTEASWISSGTKAISFSGFYITSE